jgi:PAS domain S-box-containing protein
VDKAGELKLRHERSDASRASAPPGGEALDAKLLANSRGVLQAILQTVVDGVVIVDPQGVVAAFNRAAQEMFGYRAEEVIGRNVSILMPEPFCGEHGRYVADYLRTGQAKIIGIGRESVGRRKDGTVFPIDLSVSEVHIGELRIFTGIIKDITRRKQLEKEILDVSEREQQKIGRDLHDGLCQELAGIAFLVQTMTQKLEAGGAVKSSEASLVTGLLQEAVRHARSLSHGLSPVEPQPLGLSVALQRLASDTSDTYKISCTYEGAQTLHVADASMTTHLYRIVQEAVRDAARHSKASHITIDLRSNDRRITLSIVDDGTDLSPGGRFCEDMVLHLMRHRARTIGAKLFVESTPGLGTRVVCELAEPQLGKKRTT